MSSPGRGLSLVVAAFLSLASAGGAQPLKGVKVPPRPKLPAGADSNDAWSYQRLGVSTLMRRPHVAADAFYWAIRLDPTLPMPYAARRVALLRINEDNLWRYITRDPGIVEHPDYRRIDSLEMYSRLKDPFMPHQLDTYLLEPFVGSWARARSELGPGFAAWFAHSIGELETAAKEYASAIRSERQGWVYRYERARVLYQLQQYDSAVSELTQFIARLKKDEKDTKRFTIVYRSTALAEYMVGLALLEAGKVAEAREAMGRALLEDLSFYMAHARLARLAAAQGDTATALAEMDLAVQAAPEDPALRNEYGLMLLLAGRPTDAEAHFRAGIALEPHYADLYVNLGQALDHQQKGADATVQYREFITRAVQGDDRAAWARKRLTELGDSR